MDRDALRKIAISAGVLIDGATGSAVLVTPETDGVADATIGTIGDNFVRHVYRIIMSNQNNSPEKISLYSGSAADNENSLLGAYTIPAYSILVVGEDIETPVYIIRPNSNNSPTTDNRIYGIIVTNDIDLTVDWYDLNA